MSMNFRTVSMNPLISSAKAGSSAITSVWPSVMPSQTSHRPSVCVQDYCTIISRIHWNLVLWLIFGDDPVPDTDCGSPFHFSHYCGMGYFRRFIRISHTATGRFSRQSEMTVDSPTIFNIQYFRSDPADIRTQNRINPKIWFWIPDHFWLTLYALAEVGDLWAQSSFILII